MLHYPRQGLVLRRIQVLYMEEEKIEHRHVHTETGTEHTSRELFFSQHMFYRIYDSVTLSLSSCQVPYSQLSVFRRLHTMPVRPDDCLNYYAEEDARPHAAKSAGEKTSPWRLPSNQGVDFS